MKKITIIMVLSIFCGLNFNVKSAETVVGKKPVWSTKKPEGTFNVWSYKKSFMKLVNKTHYPVLWQLYKGDKVDPHKLVLLAEYQQPAVEKKDKQVMYYIYHDENFKGVDRCITKIEATIDPGGRNLRMEALPGRKKRGWCKKSVKPLGDIKTGWPGWRAKVYFDKAGGHHLRLKQDRH